MATIRARGEAGGSQAPADRKRSTRHSYQSASVVRHLLDADVACHGRDAQDIEFLRSQRHENGYRVIDTWVTVNNDFPHLSYPITNTNAPRAAIRHPIADRAVIRVLSTQEERSKIATGLSWLIATEVPAAMYTKE